MLFYWQLIWPQKVSYDDFKEMCDILRGKIPVISDNKGIEGLALATFNKFSLLGEPSKNTEACMVGSNSSVFWLGQRKLLVNSTWRDPYNASADFKNFTIIDSPEDCAYVFGDRIEPTACHNKFPCGVCEMEAGKLLKLKGLCADVIGTVFDTDYYIYGTKNGRPHFR